MKMHCGVCGSREGIKRFRMGPGERMERTLCKRCYLIGLVVTSNRKRFDISKYESHHAKWNALKLKIKEALDKSGVNLFDKK